ncbi:MAG: hypothetical protein ACI9Y1_000677 [Lentisphaeria bacterium]|jgi:hypothetical protein
MQYTKPMIELVYEIRRLVPSELKPGVKLANPDLFKALIDHYFNGAKTVTKALVKELLVLAGEDWSDVLKNNETLNDRYYTTMYRGAVSLEKPMDRVLEQGAKKPKRIYRGQVVA